MQRVIATAPGKVMLAGEYAVLDGGRAIVAAVDRRAIAIVDPACVAPSRSLFLDAARAAVARDLGDAAAAGFDHLTVDTDALRDGARKLGLGSSAAATVAAIAAVVNASDVGPVPRVHVVRCAREAHAAAQASLGARGSGADVFASGFGGVQAFSPAPAGPGEPTRPGDSATGTARWFAASPGGGGHGIALPSDLVLAFAWTGQPADTATLVAAVQAARAATPGPVERALEAIAAAADALAAAKHAEAAVAAIAAGGRAMTALAAATGVALVPPAVDDLAARLAPLGAAAKTTGAGGGDIVLIAAPRALDRAALDAAIVGADLTPLALAIDPLGVDVRAA